MTTLNQLKKYRVDIHDPRCIWYLAKEITKSLGYINTSQTIKDYCHQVSDTTITKKQSNGSERSMRVKVISEEDVLRLIEHAQQRCAPSETISPNKALTTAEEIDAEIARLTDTLGTIDTTDLENIHLTELEDIQNGYELDRIEMEQGITEEIQDRVSVAKGKAQLKADQLMRDAFAKADRILALAKQNALQLVIDAEANAKLTGESMRGYKAMRDHAELSHERALQNLRDKHERELLEAQSQPGIRARIERLKERKHRLLLRAGFSKEGY